MSAKYGKREQAGDELTQQAADQLALNNTRRLVMYLETQAPQTLTLHTVWRLLATLRKVYDYENNEALLAAASVADVAVMGAGDDE